MIGALIVVAVGLAITFWYLNTQPYTAVREESVAVNSEKSLSIEETRKQKLQEQKDLISRYARSELIQQVLKEICKGDPQKNKPEVIIIRDDSIQSTIYGETIIFNFEAHRIHNLPNVIKSYEAGEGKYIVKPQVAMAEALNAWLDWQYTIFDEADIRYWEKDIGGETMYGQTYCSDHVIMKLTSTLPNKSF